MSPRSQPGSRYCLNKTPWKKVVCVCMCDLLASKNTTTEQAAVRDQTGLTSDIPSLNYQLIVVTRLNAKGLNTWTRGGTKPATSGVEPLTGLADSEAETSTEDVPLRLDARRPRSLQTRARRILRTDATRTERSGSWDTRSRPSTLPRASAACVGLPVGIK